MGLLSILLLISGLYIALRYRTRPWLLRILSMVLMLGLVDFGLHIYFLLHKNCGVDYDPDIGCLHALPSWYMVAGLILLAVALVLSLLIIVLHIRDKHAERTIQQ